MIYDKLKIITIYALGGTVFLGLLWLTLRFILPIFLPFIFAYAIAYILRAGAKKLSGLTQMNENILKAIILITSVFALFLLLWFGASAAFSKLSQALSAISDDISGSGGITETMQRLITEIGERFGGQSTVNALTNLLSEATTKISAFIASFAASFVSALPSFAIGCAVSIAALFYFTFGYEKAAMAIRSILPQKSRTKIFSYIKRAMRGLGRFVKAYSLIIIVTFTELFFGFLILRIDNAFVLAAIISIVDFLPILGVGGVLVPWAVIGFAMGNTYTSVGLLILLVIIWAVRQPVESKLIGRGAGVHPIFALAAVYAGFRLAGVFGMIAAPILLTAVAVTLKNEKTHLENESLI
ncbi:MAG: AI-2E family transporter [Clostridia bacterium]|nr:AI-2E family transporter [Clostridia bacterium]